MRLRFFFYKASFKEGAKAMAPSDSFAACGLQVLKVCNGALWKFWSNYSSCDIVVQLTTKKKRSKYIFFGPGAQKKIFGYRNTLNKFCIQKLNFFLLLYL